MGAEEVVHARPCTPETPDQIFPSSQLIQTTVHDDTVTCPDGGISLTACERVGTHDYTTGRDLSAQQLCSPSTSANIRVRRSTRNSALLLSPARAGYATRMRQIFEDAGHDQSELQSTSRTLYPQLANISRKASPSPPSPPTQSTHNPSKYRLESLCLPKNPPSVAVSIGDACASLAHQSQRSSGSWSDDSGYILTNNSHTRGPSFILTPDERIRMWLRELPDWNKADVEEDFSVPEQGAQDFDSRDNQAEMPTLASGRVNPSGSVLREHNTTYTIPGRNSSKLASSECNQLGFNPFNQVHTPSAKARPDTQLLEEGDIQLSPLSPNVCIERGPARHHSNRKHRELTTNRSPILFQAPRLKENVVLKIEGNDSRESPLTPRSDRFNRVSWRLK